MRKLTNSIYKVCLAVCCVATGLLGACVNDDFMENTSGTTPQEPGLYFSLATDGGMVPAVSRASGVDALNENLITRANIFIFKSDGTLNTGGYATATWDAADTGSKRVAVYTGSSWKTNFTDNETYTVYALANYKGNSDLSAIQSLDDLKALTDTDTDIVMWEGMGSPAYDGKTFLMDGHATFTTTDFPAGNEPYELSVNVARAAIKVELTLNFSESWASKFTATSLEAQVTNHATVTAAIAEGNPLDADQRGYQTYPQGASDVKDNFTDDFVYNRTDGINGSQIRFYAYVNRWDDLATNETMLLIDLPGNYTEGGQQETLAHNFYKIPILSNAAPQILERNTFYQITATVDMLGTNDPDVPVVLTDVQFKTAEWVSSTVNVGNDGTPSYLILSDYHIDIRNADGYEGLEFYSSSPITEVEIVGFNNQAAATVAGVDFTYPGGGTSIPGAFFINKNNVRTSVTLSNPTFTQNATSGNITINSPNPVNVTKRYITLRVTNQNDISKYVVVEQYPLEYIQPIAGYYSYRDDFLSEGVSPENEPCYWGRTFTKIGNERDDEMPTSTSDNTFQSKVYYNGNIYNYSFSDNGNSYSSQRGFSTDTNNNMYFVTITQTSDKYKLARPLRDANDYTVGTEENTNLLSPTFMLASRLGTVQPMDYSEAQEHCAKYVEVTQDGIELDDWRLPTKVELQIIEKYQTSTPDVMDEVLALSYWGDVTRYWGAAGRYRVRYTNENEGVWEEGTNTRNSVWIRCIRDVLPTDAFMQQTNN